MPKNGQIISKVGLTHRITERRSSAAGRNEGNGKPRFRDEGGRSKDNGAKVRDKNQVIYNSVRANIRKDNYNY